MELVQAPRRYSGSKPTLMLCGSITESDWQSVAIPVFRGRNVCVVNPRPWARQTASAGRDLASDSWSVEAFRNASGVMMWLDTLPGTTNSLALFQLGQAVGRGARRVGIDPEHPRRRQLTRVVELASTSRQGQTKVVDHPAEAWVPASETGTQAISLLEFGWASVLDRPLAVGIASGHPDREALVSALHEVKPELEVQSSVAATAAVAATMPLVAVPAIRQPFGMSAGFDLR